MEEEVEPNEVLTFSALLGAEATRKKRERDALVAPLAFEGVGEDDEPERRIELFVGENPEHSVWEHKTLYCLREKQDEEANKGRFWVSWRRFGGEEGARGRVAVMVRTREWMPKERKYRLKQVKGHADRDGWRLFAVHDAERKKVRLEGEELVVDAQNVRVKFVDRMMSLQEAMDMISGAINPVKK